MRLVLPSSSVLLVEVLGALFSGSILAAIAYHGSGLVLSRIGVESARLPLMISATILAFGLGAGWGANWAGRNRSQRGNDRLALAASLFTSTVLTVGANLLSFPLGLFLTLGIAIAIILIAAVAGYNLRP